MMRIFAETWPAQMARDLGGEDYAGLDRSENTITYPGSRFANIRGVKA